MALHGLAKVTVGVPNVADTIAYYTEFGLEHRGHGVFATRDGGDQLEIVSAPTRRLVELAVAADTPDDSAAVASRMSNLGQVVTTDPDGSVRTVEPVTGTVVRVEVRPRIA